jgi:type I restriction enzyme, S subunit
VINQAKIPKNWTWKKLADISNIIGGFARPKDEKSYENGSMPFVRMRDLGLYHQTTNLSKTESLLNVDFVKKNNLRIIKKGSILLPRSGSVALNHRAILGVDACIVSHICAIELKDPEVFNYYLYYVLRQIDMKKYSKKTTGLDLITFQDLGKIKVPIPPMETQKIICSLLGKTERLLQWRKESDKLTNDYIDSIFLKIFGDPVKNPMNWVVKKLNQACTRITDGTHGSPPNSDKGDFPYITAKNITKEGITLDNVTYINSKNHEEIYRRCNPVRGDVLYIKDGATTGIAQVNKFDFQFSLLSSVALLKPSKEINSDYLAYLLNSESMYKKLRSEMAGVAITRLTITKIENFVIPVPPIKLQEAFSKIVGFIEEIKGDQKASNQQINGLQNCLVQELFKGVMS